MSTINPSKEDTRSYCKNLFNSRFKVFQVVKGLPGTNTIVISAYVCSTY